MGNSFDRLITVKELMRLLGVSRSWVYDAAARGIIPSIRVGSMLRFDMSAIRAWLAQQQNVRYLRAADADSSR
jgi:excisionase family DNA binding protein